MHAWRKYLLTAIVVLVAAGALLVRYGMYVAHPWTRDGQVRAQVVQVTSRVTAPLVNLPVRDNQLVRQGDLLFQIDPSDSQLAVDNAVVELDQARETVTSLAAAVRAAEAQVNEARAGLVSAKGQIGAAEADLEASRAKVTGAEAGVVSARAAIVEQQAKVDEAAREAERARRLSDKKAGSVETAESKEASLAAAKAQLQIVQADLSEAQAQLAETTAGVTQAEANLVITHNGVVEAQASLDTAAANLEQARADLGEPGDANVHVRQAKVALATAELQLQRTSIHAPVDGYVTNLSLQIGDQAVANQAVLALVDINSFWIDAYFKENLLDGIEAGDRAIVTLMSYPDQPFEGRVDSVAWGISQSDGSTGEDLLPSVSPTFEWIRLAQRVPVEIGHLDLPAGVKLRVGTTASVLVMKGSAGESAARTPVAAPSALE